MANISSINGNPIVVGTSGVNDGAVTDAKLVQTGGVLERVGSLVSYADITISDSNTYFLKFSFATGKTYTVTNNSSALVNCSTRVVGATGQPDVDNVGNIAAGASMTFTASGDALYLRVYLGTSTTGFVRVENMSARVPEIEAAVDGLESDVVNLGAVIAGLKSGSVDIQVSGTGTEFFDYKFEQGVLYRLTNNTEVNLNATTRNVAAAGYPDIDSFGNIGTGMSKSILATGDAAYLRVYSSAAGSVSLEVIDGVNNHIIVDKSGNGEFASLTAAVLFATEKMDATIDVLAGEYDIISEYTDEYGDNFFDDYPSVPTSMEQRGIVLKNRVTINFAHNAYVKCIYEGDNEYAQNFFSPFNSGKHGFTLNGLRLYSENVRYAIHDERRSDTDFYVNNYKNCNIRHNKSDGAGFYQAIGGGLGYSGIINIENCIISSVGVTTANVVSWHNSVLSGAQSFITIKDSILEGTARFGYYGASGLVSTMIVTNCKLNAEPYVNRESDAYDTVNVEIQAWNNVISE